MKVYTHSKYSYVRIVEIPKNEIELIDFDICKQPRETLGNYYNRMTRKPEVLINAGFFNTKTYEACFSTYDDGNLVYDREEVREGFGIIKDRRNEMTYGTVDDPISWYDFVAGYPVLVRDGKPITKVTQGSEINYNALRSCVGYSDDKVIVLTVSKPGMKFIPLANILAELGCTYAINLDGGGSSRLLVNGVVENVPTENRSVDSVLAIYLKNEEVKEEKTESEPYISYTVKYGDSLWKIATYYYNKGAQYKKIIEFNNLTSSVLKVGQILKIPVDSEKYIIQKGDTLWGIASKKMGTGHKYTQLAEYNDIDPKAALEIGQIIYIPV